MTDLAGAAAAGTRRAKIGARALASALRLPRRRLQTMSSGGAVYLGNAGIAFLIRLAGAGFGFGLQVLLARLLSLADYGLYVTFWTWLFVAGQIATLGFNDSCLRFLPRYLARGRLDDARGYLSTGYRVVVAGSLVISAIGLSAIAIVSSLPPASMPGDQRWFLLAIVFAGVPFLAFELYLEGIARSFGWFVLSTAPAYVLRPIVLALAVIAAAAAGLEFGATTALGIAVAVTGFMTVGQAAVLRRRIRGRIGHHATPTVGRKRRRLWLTATLPLIVVYGVEEIYFVSDILLLGLLADPADVGIYFAAVRVMTLAGYVYYAFMLISSREFSLARANRDHDDLQQRVRYATWWTFWLTVPTVLATLAVGRPLLAMFGSDYVAGYGVLAVLGVGLIARASVGQAGDLLVVLGHQRANLAVAVMSLVLNVLLALALVPIVGILGAAIGTACSQAARAVALRHFARSRANLETFVLGRGGRSRPKGLERRP